MASSNDAYVARLVLRAGLATPGQLADAEKFVGQMRARGVKLDLLGALVDRKVIDRAMAGRVRARVTATAGVSDAGVVDAEAVDGPGAEEGHRAAPDHHFVERAGAAPSSAVCHRHSDKPAEASCAHCGRPLCGDCAIRTESGAFCSDTCAARARLARRLSWKQIGAGLAAFVVAVIVLWWALAPSAEPGRARRRADVPPSESSGEPARTVESNEKEMLSARESAARLALSEARELLARDPAGACRAMLRVAHDYSGTRAARDAAAEAGRLLEDRGLGRAAGSGESETPASRESAAREALSEARGFLDRDAAGACRAMRRVVRDHPGTRAARDAATEADLLLEDPELRRAFEAEGDGQVAERLPPRTEGVAAKAPEKPAHKSAGNAAGACLRADTHRQAPARSDPAPGQEAGKEAMKEAGKEAKKKAEGPAPATRSLPDIMAEMNRCVVMVSRKDGHGSGLIVRPPTGDGWYVATNRHVIEGASELEIYGFRERKKVQFAGAKIYAVHKDADVALVSIDPPPSGFKAARLGDTDRVRQGDEVFTYGSPGGVEADKVLEQTATNGIVSARGREIEGQKCFQTTAAVNPGNSGGPLFNRRGEVVGINTYATVLEGTNFAIDLGYLLELLKGENALPEDDMERLVRKGDPMHMLRRRTLVARAKVSQPVTKLLVDPRRKKLLAFIRGENSIFVYDLPGLEKAGELFVGSNPTDFDYDVDSGLAVVALATPPQVGVFDLEKMKRVSLAKTKRIHAIRWLGKDRAVAVWEDHVPELRLVAFFGGWSGDVASLAEVNVLRVSILGATSGRTRGLFRNTVIREEARETRKKLDGLSRQVRVETRLEGEALAKCVSMLKRRLKALETSFRAPTLGASPDKRTLIITEPDGDKWAVMKMRTASAYGVPTRFRGKAGFHLPEKEKGYRPDLQRTVFDGDGTVFVFGDSVCDVQKASILGTVKHVDVVWQETRELCNVFAVNSDASLAFTGTHVFSLEKFVPVARLPFMSSVVALGPEERIVYAFEPRLDSLIGVSLEKILAEGKKGTEPPPGGTPDP